MLSVFTSAIRRCPLMGPVSDVRDDTLTAGANSNGLQRTDEREGPKWDLGTCSRRRENPIELITGEGHDNERCRRSQQ